MLFNIPLFLSISSNQPLLQTSQIHAKFADLQPAFGITSYNYFNTSKEALLERCQQYLPTPLTEPEFRVTYLGGKPEVHLKDPYPYVRTIFDLYADPKTGSLSATSLTDQLDVEASLLKNFDPQRCRQSKLQNVALLACYCNLPDLKTPSTSLQSVHGKSLAKIAKNALSALLIWLLLIFLPVPNIATPLLYIPIVKAYPWLHGYVNLGWTILLAFTASVPFKNLLETNWRGKVPKTFIGQPPPAFEANEGEFFAFVEKYPLTKQKFGQALPQDTADLKFSRNDRNEISPGYEMIYRGVTFAQCKMECLERRPCSGFVYEVDMKTGYYCRLSMGQSMMVERQSKRIGIEATKQ